LIVNKDFDNPQMRWTCSRSARDAGRAK